MIRPTSDTDIFLVYFAKWIYSSCIALFHGYYLEVVLLHRYVLEYIVVLLGYYA